MNNKVFLRITIIVLFMIILFSGVMIAIGKTEKKEIAVSVILRDSTNNRWQAFRNGIEQAAADYDAKINVVSTNNYYSVVEIESIINREVENGAEVIILDPIGTEELKDYMTKMSGRVSFVLVDGSIDPPGLFPTVRGDDQAIGQALSQALIDDYGDNLKNKKIEIVAGIKDAFSTNERIQGFYNRLSSSGIECKDVVLQYTDDSLNSNIRNDIEENYPDIIVAFGDYETVESVKALNELGRITPVYGKGHSEESVYYLDSDKVKTLVVVNDFNMGYITVEAAVGASNYKKQNSNNICVEVMTVNKSNLYDSYIQNIMFPNVQ